MDFHDYLKTALERCKKELPYHEILKRINMGESYFWKVRVGERAMNVYHLRALLHVLHDHKQQESIDILLSWLLPEGYQVVQSQYEHTGNEIKESFDVLTQAGLTVQTLSQALSDGQLVPYEKKEILKTLSKLEKEIQELKQCLKDS